LIHDEKFTAQEIIAASDKVINQMQTQLVAQKDIDRAIVKLRSGFLRHFAAIRRRRTCRFISLLRTIRQRPEQNQSIEANFRKITPAVIQKTAKEYLRSTNRTIVILNVRKAAAITTAAK
jgi:predicted Zn-dependent peptidase